MSTRSEALADALDRMGLGSDAALVLHFPLRYEDETRITPVALARAGQPVQVEVEVTQAEVKFRPRRQLVVTAGDDSGTVTLRFFNFYPSQQKQLTPGKRVRLFGDIGRAIEFAHGFTDLRVPVLKSVRRDDGIFGWDAVYSVL